MKWSDPVDTTKLTWFDYLVLCFAMLILAYGLVQGYRSIVLGFHCRVAVVHDALGRPLCVNPNQVWIRNIP